MVVLADGMATARRTTPAPAPPNLLQAKLAALTAAQPSRAAAPAKAAPPPSRQAAPAKPAARVSAPAAPRVSAPSVSSGGGGSVGTQSFGGGASPVSFAPVTAAEVAPPPPAMEDITIPDPYADPTFQKQKAQLAAAKADFDASQGLARSQYDNTMGTSMRQLGWRDGVGFDPRARGTAYGTAFEGNAGDFAGRGLLHSGSYAEANADMDQDFNDRRSGMLTQQKDFRDTQDLTARNFVGQQKSVEEEALSNVIQAIAAKYSVNNDQITPGRQNVIQRERLA